MFDPAAEVARRRAAYGRDEHQAHAVYGDLVAALQAVGLHPYIETRGGLAVCAFTQNGTLLTVACQTSLPILRRMVVGWHVTHVPEDEPGPAWRCVVYDTVPDDLCCDPPGDLRLDPMVDAITNHLATCEHTAGQVPA